MNSTFLYRPAIGHSDARVRRGPAEPTRARRLIVAGVAVLAAAGATCATAAAASTPSHGPATPNDCVAVNGGDYTACNVGNTGRGDLPYQSAPWQTPEECVRVNGGDYTACNVGNTGRGDLPYRSVQM
jgi:roadblock/LC7 domain-containing protein